MKKIISYTVIPALATLLPAMPVQSQDGTDIQRAASQIEIAIQSTMSKAGQSGQPTLGQLGGVQGGSTSSDASGGAGGEGDSGGGGGGGGGCFAPETLVLMSDGTYKPIVEVQVGDNVASWDFNKKTVVPASVEHVYQVQRDLYYKVDGVRVTSEHPYCTAPGQFTEVQFLHDDSLVAEVTETGLSFCQLDELSVVRKPGTFYNMTVSGTHTYIVSPAKTGERKLVHNKGGSD